MYHFSLLQTEVEYFERKLFSLKSNFLQLINEER